MKKLQRGVLITFEGIDGSGKTTLINHLATYFASTFDIITTREPGGSILGNTVRALVSGPEIHLDHKAEFLLFAAARAQHIKHVIAPALTQHKIILCDRMADSSLAYQGYGRGLDINFIKCVNEWVMDGIRPDLTFYIALNHQEALIRIHQRGAPTAFDQEQSMFFERVIAGYEAIFKHASHVRNIDGAQLPSRITSQAINDIANYLAQECL